MRPALPVSIMLCSALALGACQDDGISGASITSAADSSPDPAPDTSDDTTPGAPSDAPGADLLDAAGGPDSADTTGPDGTLDGAPDAAPDAPEPWPMGGVTDGDTLIVAPELLDGLFVYGLGAEPGTFLTQIGNTAAGLIALLTVLEVADGILTIRVFDAEVGAPVSGPDGVIERYPAQTQDDGAVVIDFGTSLQGLEVQLWQQCVYQQSVYQLDRPPVYADGLMTWAVNETYAPNHCGNGGFGVSEGLNVHFLRRTDANPDFVTRDADDASPFGFFRTPKLDGSGDHLARLPGIGPAQPDGTLAYYIDPDNFPDEMRYTAEQVMARWNDGLEAAGLNRAFVVHDAPPDVIPWDPRYRVIWWDTADTGGAIAPFIDDPLTGEIFEADVILWLGEIQTIIDKYSTFFDKFPEFDPGPVDPVGPEMAKALDGAGLPARVLRRRVIHRRPLNTRALAMQVSTLSATMTPDEIARYILADFLTHEIGHNLGLRHNFKGSIDQDLAKPGAASSTTMDYVWGVTAPGTYDVDAMRYGYGDGATAQGYLYCTDEDIPLDPGCARWDFGHPVEYWLSVLDDLAAEYPPGTPTGQLDDVAEDKEWGDVFLNVRQFVNTDYELWDPSNPTQTVQELLDRVICADACATHVWFRQRWALQLLYTKHVVYGDWHDLPPLSATQAALVLGEYYALVLDDAQPLALKQTIIGKLPTANVIGAQATLDDLWAWYSALESPTQDQQALGAAIQDALGN